MTQPTGNAEPNSTVYTSRLGNLTNFNEESTTSFRTAL